MAKENYKEVLGKIKKALEIVEEDLSELDTSNVSPDKEAYEENFEDLTVAVIVDPAMEGMNDFKPAKSVQELIEAKGLDVVLSKDGKHLSLKGSMSFSNFGKKKAQDYQPSQEELDLINKHHSNMDLTADQIMVFTLRSADMAIDRSYEHFTENALGKMAQLSVGKAFLMDHDWTTKSQIGKIFAATVANGQLMQKVYVLNDDYNRKIVNNILAGIYNKVSVGFSVDLNDMVCASCETKSYYDNSCEHQVGAEDEKGVTTVITIKSVSDYYEVSLVPIPAQRDAGITRSLVKSLEDKQEEFSQVGKTFTTSMEGLTKVLASSRPPIVKNTTEIIKDLQEILTTETKNSEDIKNSGTIINDKSILGDPIVIENKQVKANTETADDITDLLVGEYTTDLLTGESIVDLLVGDAPLEQAKPQAEKKQVAQKCSCQAGAEDAPPAPPAPEEDAAEEKSVPEATKAVEVTVTLEAVANQLIEALTEAVKAIKEATQAQVEAAKAIAEANEERSKGFEVQLKEQAERVTVLCEVVEQAATIAVDPFKVAQSTKSTQDTLKQRLMSLGGQ